MAGRDASQLADGSQALYEKLVENLLPRLGDMLRIIEVGYAPDAAGTSDASWPEMACATPTRRGSWKMRGSRGTIYFPFPTHGRGCRRRL
jgi:hypothetical protein